MRKFFALAVALLSSATCMAQTEAAADEPLMLAQQAPRPALSNSRVPRPAGASVGLTNVPNPGKLFFGLSPTTAAVIGVVLAGGVAVAIAGDGDDDPAPPPGSGSGGTGGN